MLSSTRALGRRAPRAARLLALALLGAALGAGVAGAAEPVPLVVAVGGPPDELAYLPVHAAVALGTFEAEGLRVTLRRTKHATAAMDALRDQEAAIAVTTLDQAVVGGFVRNAPVRVVAAHTRAPGAVLLVAPSRADALRKVADLRGQPVGIPGPGTAGHALLMTLLGQARVDAWRVDVRSVAGPAVAGRLAAGELAAAVVEEPWASRLLEAGAATALVDFRRPDEAAQRLGGPFYEIVSVARVAVPAPKPVPGKPSPKPAPPAPPEAALVGFARAVARTQTWLGTAPPATVVERLSPGTIREGARLEPRLAAFQPLYALDGEPTREGVATTLRVLRTGSPWPVTLRLDADDLLPLAAVTAARRALGPSPPPP